MSNNGLFTNDFKTYVNLGVPKSHPHRKGEVLSTFKVSTNDDQTAHVALVRYKDSSTKTVVMDQDDSIPPELPVTPGRWFANTANKEAGPYITMGPVRIAHLGARIAYGTLANQETAKANAVLAASSKELYEALQSLEGAVLSGFGTEKSIEMAIAALNKAKGIKTEQRQMPVSTPR